MKNSSRDHPIGCSQCDREFYSRYKCVNSMDALRHVLTHLPITLFRCRHCPMKGKNKSSMKRHLATHHGIPWNTFEKHFTDLTYKHQDKVIAMIHRCYANKSDGKNRFAGYCFF